jgi:2-octaprenyl-6-methoxyphenol hydroxylase
VAPLKLARDIGLGLVNRVPQLKRMFMRHAMGTSGDLPRLMRA